MASTGAPLRDTVIVALPAAEAERFIAAHRTDRSTAVDCGGWSRSTAVPVFRVSSASPPILSPVDSLRGGRVLLIRIAENQTQDTWRNLRRELQRLHQGTFRGNAGLVHKTSETTAAQLRILRALGVDPPPVFPALTLAA